MEGKLGFKESQQRSEGGTAHTKESKRLENPKNLIIDDIMSILNRMGDVSDTTKQEVSGYLDKMDEEFIIKRQMFVLAAACVFKANQKELSRENIKKFEKQYNGMPFGINELDLIRYVRMMDNLQN